MLKPLLLLALAAQSDRLPLSPPGTEEAAVMAPVPAVLVAVRTRDKDAVAAETQGRARGRAARTARVSGCPPVPTLAPGPRFPNGEGPATVRAVAPVFAAAYRRACRDGLVKRGALVAPTGRLLLLNAPLATVALITEHEGDAVLEYWYVGEDGVAHVPTVDDLHEAIFCHLKGATKREQEQEGRCLPD